MRNPIAPIIIEKFPYFLKSDFKKLDRFLTHFYTFLEEQGNPLDVLERFYENSEANREVDQYIQKIVSELGFTIDQSISISHKELIHHLRDFYLSRGSANSFNFLFKILYGSEIEIYYPRTRLFIPSTSTYSSRYFIFTSARSSGTKEYYAILEQSRLFNVKVEGVASGEVAYVEEISQVYSKGVEYLKIQIDSKSKNFRPGEGIRIISDEARVRIIETVKPVLGFTITDSGQGYSVNDLIIVNASSPSFIPVVPGIAHIGGIQEGGIDSISIISGGNGYAYGQTILPQKLKRGNSLSGMVSGVSTSNSYLSIPTHTSLQLENKIFTIDLWIQRKRNITEEAIIGNHLTGSSNGWTLLIKGDDTVCFQYTPTVSITAPVKLVPNQWYHIAVMRDSLNEVSLFINGVLQAVKTLESNVISTNPIVVGKWKETEGSFSGFINDLRITTGVARYTSSGFSPSRYLLDINEDPFESSVSLLLQSQGSNGSTSFVDSSTTLTKTITAQGSVSISTAESVFGTSSCEFKGLGTITKVTILNHGMDYAELPDLIIQSSGTGAELQASSTSIGRIETIHSVEPYVDFDETQISITVQSENGSGAVITPKMIAIFVEMPTLTSYEGVLGINCTLLDSLYYQQFSYSIQSEISRYEYDPFVDLWCHPAGFIRFATLLIMSSSFFPELSDNFYLTKIEIIYGLDNVFMINPMYNLHWFKELSNFNYKNWVGGFDWIKEEWTADAHFYLSQALDAYPGTIRHSETQVDDLLLNPQTGLDWFKHSDPLPGFEDYSNYSYVTSVWDDFTSGDPPLGTTDPAILARKRFNDNTIPMQRALEAEIEIV